MTQAVILAGGKGTRLAERLNGRPKPLVDVDGIPLLERQLRALAAHGVDDVFVLVNHAAEQIEAFVSGRDFGCKVRLVHDGEPKGTAGAVLACIDMLAERFLIVYGDTLFDIDLEHMIAAHEMAGADATLLLHPNDHPADSDLVELASSGAIQAFHSYPHAPGRELRNLVNAALYVVERSALEPWRSFSTPCDFAKDLFPAMLVSGAHLNGFVSFEYIKDLGTPSRLDKVVGHLRNGVVARASRSKPQSAVFIDRDGTLNALKGYISRPEDLVVLPGVPAAVKRLNDAEYRVVMITNQPVVARGECTDEELQQIHNRLESVLGAEGAYLDATFYCPHHPDAGFPGEVTSLKFACECRKPSTGLFVKAIAMMNIDPCRSWMVGDTTSDLLAAERVGVSSVLVATGEGGADGKYPVAPDFVAHDFGAAVRLIVDVYPLIVNAVGSVLSKVAPGELILVGGPARSGKTTLTGVLKRELRSRGLNVQSLSLDRWILPEADRGTGVYGRYGIAEAQASLLGWLEGSGCELSLPGYDRSKRLRVEGGNLKLSKESILILEGVPALLADWPTARSTRRLYVTGDEDARRTRVIDDLVDRGLATPQQAVGIYNERQADEVELVEAGRSFSDVVLSLDAIVSGRKIS
ncbi:HAD-IIIA family hydrolase [Bradyrhizobium sp. 40]|uniref:HAD-IIIA family hydrolase n=1 Tax=Bradyrhizobium sp. 40 TaxID=2782674 RepID=UPI001FFEE47D|nr:HAD-IIIA family hydrolase [Bradyrhizobium sp. 40]UPJ41130.1 HAD-IIIA family hydrolase [Bradyrhizobium sp. 40]